MVDSDRYRPLPKVKIVSGFQGAQATVQPLSSIKSGEGKLLKRWRPDTNQ